MESKSRFDYVDYVICFRWTGWRYLQWRCRLLRVTVRIVNASLLDRLRRRGFVSWTGG